MASAPEKRKRRTNRKYELPSAAPKWKRRLVRVLKEVVEEGARQKKLK